AARKAGAVFSIRARRLLCRPRWGMGRRNAVRSGLLCAGLTSRARVDNLLAVIRNLCPCTCVVPSWSTVSATHRALCHRFAVESRPNRISQEKGLRTALLWEKKASMTHSMLGPGRAVPVAALALAAAAAPAPARAAAQTILLAPH